MKRGSRLTSAAVYATGMAKSPRAAHALVQETDELRPVGRDGAATLRKAVRETEPPGAFDMQAIEELYKAAPADPKRLRRTIRRRELRQIVPLADSTIYELERRGKFPKRFFLTARCVVWDLAEVLAWLQSRRQMGSNVVRKAPMPDVRQRTSRPIREMDSSEI